MIYWSQFCWHLKMECTPIWPPPASLACLSGPAALVAFLKWGSWAMCVEHHLVVFPTTPNKCRQVYIQYFFFFSWGGVAGYACAVSSTQQGQIRGSVAQFYNKLLVGIKVKRKVEIHLSLKLWQKGLIFEWLIHNNMVFKHKTCQDKTKLSMKPPETVSEYIKSVTPEAVSGLYIVIQCRQGLPVINFEGEP